MHGIRLFFVNGLFFHGAWGGEDWGLLFVQRMRELIGMLGNDRPSLVLCFVVVFLSDFFFACFFFNRDA
jgi:hypothetical protein